MWNVRAILSAVQQMLSNDVSTIKNTILTIATEISGLLQRNYAAKRIGVFLGWNILLLFIILFWALETKSLCLLALVQLVVFNVLYLLVAIASLWLQDRPANPLYTFGYARYEVLSVFVANMLTIFSALFLLKESVERIFEYTAVSSNYLLFSALLTLMSHFVTVYSVDNPSMDHVIQASSSSWLQEQMTDVCETVCYLMPCLSRLLLPRLNPVLLVGIVSSLLVLCAHFALSFYDGMVMDTVVGALISFMMFATVMPMANYSGRILLQTAPGPLLSQIDKALREAGTIDGVLEVKKRHFWSIGFGQLAGSVHVRVRRDANEQLVLAHITSRLEPLAQQITVQVFKDDWTRSLGHYSAFQRHGLASHLHNFQTPTQPMSIRAASPFTSQGYNANDYAVPPTSVQLPDLVPPSNRHIPPSV
jgi:solute carrier family 30 (zinc transporter), member 6